MSKKVRDQYGTQSSAVYKNKKSALVLDENQLPNLLGLSGIDDSQRMVLEPRILLLFAFCFLLFAFFMPWSSRVDIPAIYKSSNEFSLYPPTQGMILYTGLESGKRVNKGDVLLSLRAPELNAEIRISEKRLKMLNTRLSRSSASKLELSSVMVLKQELQAEQQKLYGLKEKQQSLTMKSPFDGLLVNIDEELHKGQWLSQSRSVGMLIEQNSITLSGLAEASDVARMKPGQKGVFIPDGFIKRKIPVEVRVILKVAENILIDEILSQEEGGLVPTTKEADEKLIPRGSWFKMELSMALDAKDLNQQTVTRGLVVIDAEPQSFASRVFRKVASVLIRESGF